MITNIRFYVCTAVVSSFDRSAISENVLSDMFAQRRFRSGCAFAQPDLNLQWAHSNNQGRNFLHAYNEDSDRTARMRRLI